MTNACINCKFTACVGVGPVDAVHEGINFLANNHYPLLKILELQ